ncbi:MAG TPA: hypothetical protein VFP38_14415, partial [Bradyrhizobium sp.]|nr:hypothetical protein [Bradyrhizobium sp.]
GRTDRRTQTLLPTPYPQALSAFMLDLFMALLSFVESAPRAYRLKVGNADLFKNSTEPGTSPRKRS